MSKRYVVECTWSGYKPSQARVCHRRVTTRPQDYENIIDVRFTDGTYMSVDVRPCRPRERVQEIHGYDDLFFRITADKMTGSISVLDVKD